MEKKGNNSKKVIMTFSYDKDFCKYFIKENICLNEEISNCIVNLLSSSCNYFASKYRIYPKRYLIYRSGVSDGEKKNLFREEIQTIENYLKNNSKDPEIIYTIINKKSDFKFFEKINGDLKNPSDGTIIDKVVTSLGCYEFYLQNQFVNQGCATPTHYHVLYSNMNIPKEEFQKITFHMSYYYWNWPGPTRLPACLKFAETYSKSLGNFEGNRSVMEKLRDKPFYI